MKVKFAATKIKRCCSNSTVSGLILRIEGSQFFIDKVQAFT